MHDETREGATNAMTPSEQLERSLAKAAESPDSAAVHFNLGLAYTRMAKMDSAESSYEKALEIDPKHARAWVNLGGARLLRWDFKGALEANEKALEIDANLLLAHYNKGQAHLYLGEAEAMLPCYERVLELNPDHATGHSFYAVGLLAAGDAARAREHLSKSMALGYRPPSEFIRELEKQEGSEGMRPAGIMELPPRGDNENKKES